MPSWTATGLEERREKRIRKLNAERAANYRACKTPTGEQKEIRKMQVFFVTLPHDQLRAAYVAVTKALEQQKTKITP